MQKKGKTDLTKSISVKLNMTQETVGKVVDALFKQIADELKKGNYVAFVDFATFKPAVIKGRNRYSVNAKKHILTQTKNTVSIKPMERLKEAVQHLPISK